MNRSNEYCEVKCVSGEKALIRFDCIEYIQENSYDNLTIVRMKSGEIETISLPYDEFKGMVLKRL